MGGQQKYLDIFIILYQKNNTMYINFLLYNLQPQDLYYIFAVKQIETEINIPNDTLQRFKDLDLITTIKGKPNQEERLKIRLSDKGKKFLDDLSTPEVTEGDCEMRDFLCDMYLNNEDEERKIGNKKAIGIYCSILRNRLGLTLHEFYYLCDYFLLEHKFTKLLEYIFFNKNKHRYSKFQDVIEDSPLYQFWEQKEQEIRQYFKTKIKE